MTGTKKNQISGKNGIVPPLRSGVVTDVHYTVSGASSLT